MSAASRARRALPELAVALVLAAGTWLVWETRLSTDGEPAPFSSFDLYAYYLPSLAYQDARLENGSLPLWNPHQGAGEPFLATLEPAVLYPPRLLLLWLAGPVRALELSLLAHVLGLVLGSYAFARALGAGRLAASGAGLFLGATYGGSWFYWPAHFEPGAWWPALALALVRVVRGGGWGWTVGLGFAGAMPVLAGGFQVTVYMGYALLPLAAGLVADARFRLLPWRKLALRLGVAALLALATSAPQLLPTLAWSGEATRRPVARSEAQLNPFGVEALDERVRKTLLPVEGAGQLYLSLPAVALAAFGFLRSGALGRVLGAGALLLYGIGLGPGSPLHPLFRALPLLSLYRIPHRLLIAVMFLLAAGVALGLDAIRRSTGRPPLGTAASAAALAALAAALLLPLENRWQLPWLEPGPLAKSLPLLQLAQSYAGDGRVAYFGQFGSLSPRFSMLGGLSSLQNYEPLSSARLERYLYAVAGQPIVGDAARLPFLGTVRGLNPLREPRLLDMTATTVVVVTPPAGDPSLEGLRPVGEYGASTVYVNARALPRAYSVGRARFVGTEELALATIRSPGFDARREAVLVGAPAEDLEHALAQGGDAAFTPARIVRDAVEEIEIEVAPVGPALLVLADAFAPGWEVRVDGRPRALRQTNFLVRGVAVGPGDRRVTFAYDPPGWRLGWLALGGGWLVTAAVIGGAHARKKAATRSIVQ